MTGYRAGQRQPQAMYHLSEESLQSFYAARDRHTSYQNAAAAAIAAATQYHQQQGQQHAEHYEGQYSQAMRRRVQPTHIGSRIPQPSLSSPSTSSDSSSSSSSGATLMEHPPSGMRLTSGDASRHYQQHVSRASAPNSLYMSQPPPQQQQQQQQQRHSLHQQPPRDFANAYPMKPVYKLSCKHCCNIICARGMKAILLADTSIELYSTDTPPRGSIQLMDKDYLTRTCRCRIRDIACLGCGNIAGYHVVSPCFQCLEACNNGHFWMFHSEFCQSAERTDVSGKQTLLWSSLPRAEMDVDFVFGNTIQHEAVCR